MGGLRSKLGILKSRFIYDFRPCKRRRMKNFYSAFFQSDIRHPAGPLAFDIGAHTGSRTSVWLDLGTRVVAVEPQQLFADFLQRKFGGRDNVTVLRAALARTEGQAELKVASNNPTVSSLSAEWAKLMSSIDGRIRWDNKEPVPVTTLDRLIAQYGKPAFCKIDVEGFEAEVLKGLSRPIASLSFEFFPTTPEQTIACIDRLEQLSRAGACRFNWVLGETFRFESEQWLSADQLKTAIAAYRGSRSGDVYALLRDSSNCR
jgi:FkbM family methyltransferase